MIMAAQLSADFIAGEVAAVAVGGGFFLWRAGREWQKVKDILAGLPCKTGTCPWRGKVAKGEPD